MWVLTRKLANNQRVATMPARFLWPWEVVEMGIQDMKEESHRETGTWYILMVVDRASKFLFSYPLETKTALGIPVCVTFRLPLWTRSDAVGQFTAHVVQHLCKWLGVPLDHVPMDHPRHQGAV